MGAPWSDLDLDLVFGTRKGHQTLVCETEAPFPMSFVKLPLTRASLAAAHAAAAAAGRLNPRFYPEAGPAQTAHAARVQQEQEQEQEPDTMETPERVVIPAEVRRSKRSAAVAAKEAICNHAAFEAVEAAAAKSPKRRKTTQRMSSAPPPQRGNVPMPAPVPVPVQMLTFLSLGPGMSPVPALLTMFAPIM
jgi:hypothetical protein